MSTLLKAGMEVAIFTEISMPYLLIQINDYNAHTFNLLPSMFQITLYHHNKVYALALQL